MSYRPFGRACAVGAIGASLVVSALTLGTPTPAAHAHEGTDPVPADLAADWLAGEEGTLTGFGGFGWGASIDAALALDAVPGHQADVDAITDALAANAANYLDYSYQVDGTTYEGQAAGSTAKLTVYAVAVGEDPRSFGGLDLVERLDELVRPSGRIQDLATKDGEPDVYGDYANVIGQSFAARALTEAGSEDAGAAVDFLLAQQCGPGWFRQDFTRPEDNDVPWDSPPATDAGCVTATDSPSVDTTALAVLQLQPLAAGDADVATAVSEAVAWLVSQQSADGALRLGSIPPNANSTGVAGAAFHLTGAHEPAEKAAAWLRGLQFSGTRCDGAAQPEIGAVAYTPDEFASAQADGVTDRTKLARVVAQAIPALLAAPESEAGLSLGYPSFLDGGGRARVKVVDLAPGEPACVGIGRFTRRVVGDVDGLVTTRVKVPNRTGFVPVVVDTADNAVGSEAHALAAKELRVSLKSTVAPRRPQRVVVRGLVAGERAVVRQAGDVVARGKAANDGRFVARFDAPRATGRHRVKVVGQFADRAGRASYRVR